MAIWPDILPLPLAAGFSVRPAADTVRTPMEVGPDLLRRIGADGFDQITAAWLFDADQMAAFRAFWRDDLINGALWFDLDLVNALGKTTATARFTEPYAAAFKAGGFYEVSGQLEASPMPVLSLDETELILTFGIAGLANSALHYWLHTTLPADEPYTDVVLTWPGDDLTTTTNALAAFLAGEISAQLG